MRDGWGEESFWLHGGILGGIGGSGWLCAFERDAFMWQYE